MIVTICNLSISFILKYSFNLFSITPSVLKKCKPINFLIKIKIVIIFIFMKMKMKRIGISITFKQVVLINEFKVVWDNSGLGNSKDLIKSNIRTKHLNKVPT